MTEAELAIPLPTRPGTFGSRCERCGKGYSSHGAPEDQARLFGIQVGQRHLLCPASDDAWADYNYKRRTVNYEATRREVIRALEVLKGHDATVPLDHVVALLPEEPEWRRR